MASAPDVRPEQAGGPVSQPAPSPADVGERLRSISINAGVPEEALEPALQAILEACGGGAGAICLFDQRTEMLRLAAECGLSDEGCQRLRSVRRGDSAAWDMPLHGLLNRRAYLIDSASKNRYVPPLVEPPTKLRTIACLPLYSGATPLGSIVLIALAPRMLGERDIRNLESPLRELVKMIEAVRRRSRTNGSAALAEKAAAPVKLNGQVTALDSLAVAQAQPDEPPSAAPPPPRPASPAAAFRPPAVDLLGDTPGRGRDGGDRTPGDNERTELLIASLAATERERARLAATLEAERAERAEQERVNSALEERRGAERGAEVERFTTRLASAEEEVTRERERVGEWERKFEALSEELRTAAAREQSVREEMNAAVERTRREMQQELQEALETARQAEEARTAAVAASESARTTLAEVEARCQALEGTQASALAEVEQLRAAAAAGEAREGEAKSRLDALEGELVGLREERDRLAASARDLEAAVAARPITPPSAKSPPLAEKKAAVAAPTPSADVVVPLEVETLPKSAPPAKAVPASLRARPEGPTVVVLDVDGTWANVTLKGHSVVVLNAEAGDAEQMAALAPERVVVNLAAPGALATLTALRAAGCRSRFWGCIGARGTKRALPLGMVEPGARPLEAEAVLAALGALASRGTRVVTTGGDVDALMSLRQAMARQGMSVSMAWDAKQAADLLVMVKPQVVVIDLESPREGYSVVAALSAADPIPHALLIPGSSGDGAAGFLPVLSDPHHAERFAPLDRILQNALRAKEAPLAERR